MSVIDEHGRVQVEWRHTGPDGPTLASEWISPFYIADGGLSYGTAMTVASAQGLTAECALIYGMGLDPHTLYAAMTRDREFARLYLPRELLETDADRALHGPVRGEADELQRALAAYAATLEGDHPNLSRSPTRARPPRPFTRQSVMHRAATRSPAPRTGEGSSRRGRNLRPSPGSRVRACQPGPSRLSARRWPLCAAPPPC